MKKKEKVERQGNAAEREGGIKAQRCLSLSRSFMTDFLPVCAPHAVKADTPFARLFRRLCETK